MGDWHNIATQDDIESLLSAYGDFHDACIVEAHFKSGTFVDEASAMHFGSANESVRNLVSLEVHASLDKSSICRNLLSILGIFC
ncbi:MAG: hypothetical protein KHX49_16455, partial [Lachnospiraceae bacterium]|nr:hypothetical protein [Lachnospiraceae bacterium]